MQGKKNVTTFETYVVTIMRWSQLNFGATFTKFSWHGTREKVKKVCRDIENFVATIIQGECQAAVSRQCNNNTEDVQQLNNVATMVNLSRQFTKDQRLNNKEDIVKTNLGDTK